MATVDLRTLPLSEQHHALAFNELGRTGRRATDFLWICPDCDDGVTHAPMSWTGGVGYYHVANGGSDFDIDATMHKLVAVDVIAVLERWRQMGVHLKHDTPVNCLGIDGMLALGAQREAIHAD
jgi:hypothetical protein